MEKEFVKYEQALDLKELGFDKSCLAIYSNANTKTGLYNLKKYKLKLIRQDSQVDKGISVPTYQSAFRWFRNEYNLHCSVEEYSPEHYFRVGWKWSIYIKDKKENFTSEDCYCEELVGYDTYEEAEEYCLRALISICKNKGTNVLKGL